MYNMCTQRTVERDTGLQLKKALRGPIECTCMQRTTPMGTDVCSLNGTLYIAIATCTCCTENTFRATDDMCVHVCV